MLLNTLENQKFKTKKTHLRPGFIGFYWAGFSMPTLSKMLALISV